MSLSLFALHSIKRIVKPAKIEKDHFGRPTVRESEEAYYIEPGTIFEALDEKEKRELIDAEAAREPTARELKLDEAGLLIGDGGGAGQPSQKSVAKIEEERKAQEERDRALMSASQKQEEPISKRAAASAKAAGGRRRGVV
jgi:hypothetical protein